MDFYWLYNIPTWALFLLINGIVCSISLLGCLILRGKIDSWLGLSEETNGIVGQFMSFTGVFYGIIFGLVAVGAWETFNSANDRAEAEASVLAGFYQDVSRLPLEAERSELEMLTRTYTWQVINREWPDQRQGISPTGAEQTLDRIGDRLYKVPAETPNLEIIVAEAIGQFNNLVESRRSRIQSVEQALPGSLWWVIIIGTFINIVMTWMLSIRNKSLDIGVNLLTSLLLGTVLAFVIAMDNPYRGELSVSADPYIQVYKRVMGGTSGL